MMSAAQQQAGPAIELEKIISATPSQVFNAWTQPSQIAKWWGASDQHETFLAEVDLREGGSYRLGMRAPDGKEFIVRGEYQEIIANKKLVFTWLWEHSDTGFPVTLVTVTFKTHDLGCQIKLKHEHMPAKQGESHAEGWQRLLNRIAVLFK